MKWYEFIEWLAPAAQRICPKYSLFASVCIAQAAIESGWSEHTIGEYNLFGRKAVSGDKSIIVETQEYEWGMWRTIYAPFKDYDSLEEAIEDWCILITQEPVYVTCLEHLDNIEHFVNILGPIYATDPCYAEKVLSTIRACDLTQYDEVTE